tara:strand:+ start:188 stop:1276 length:1089 start_codon:yes stop_codon:yes gene_type:complete
MKPKDFAAKFRYSDDKVLNIESLSNVSNLEIFEVHNSLLITKTAAPLIYESLTRTTHNLLIKPKNVNLYVYASSEINAKCYNGINGGYVVILSSSLVNLLEGKELDFVIGHELGHLLLEHTKEKQDRSPEGLRLSRAKEISVDRIGLVGSRDLDATLRAIIKTVSGLSNDFLNFNTTEFIDQLRKFDLDSSKVLDQTTHPSFTIRAKALLSFSTSDVYQELFDSEGKDIALIDKSIKRDMDKHIDSFFNFETERLKNNLNFWITCFSAISDKSLSLPEQKYIAKHFGEERLEKFKKMIVGKNLKNIENVVNQKLLESFQKLSNFRSISVSEDVEYILNNLPAEFKIDNLREKILKLINISTY